MTPMTYPTPDPENSTDLTVFQQAFVSDHIAGLEREGAALRAERARDDSRAHERAASVRADDLGVPTRRVRLGRWLVAVGEAIAGTRDTVAEPFEPIADNDPRDDAAAGLPRAA